MATETITQALARLTLAGFTDDLVLDGAEVRATRSGITYEPDDLVIIELLRFWDDSDPADEQAVLALATGDGGAVGTLVVPFGPRTSPEEVEFVTALHQRIDTPAEIAAHDEHDHIAAVFPSRHAAEAAVDELRRLGLGSDRLGVAVHGDELYTFERDAEGSMERDMAAGAVLGLPIGALAGIALVGLAVPGVGSVGVGGILAAGAAGGGLGGAMLGGVLGTAAAADDLRAHQDLEAVALEPGQVLVAAAGHGHADAVRAVLERHDGRIVREHEPRTD